MAHTVGRGVPRADLRLALSKIQHDTKTAVDRCLTGLPLASSYKGSTSPPPVWVVFVLRCQTTRANDRYKKFEGDGIKFIYSMVSCVDTARKTKRPSETCPVSTPGTGR